MTEPSRLTLDDRIEALELTDRQKMLARMGAKSARMKFEAALNSAEVISIDDTHGEEVVRLEILINDQRTYSIIKAGGRP